MVGYCNIEKECRKDEINEDTIKYDFKRKLFGYFLSAKLLYFELVLLGKFFIRDIGRQKTDYGQRICSDVEIKITHS